MPNYIKNFLAPFLSFDFTFSLSGQQRENMKNSQVCLFPVSLQLQQCILVLCVRVCVCSYCSATRMLCIPTYTLFALCTAWSLLLLQRSRRISKAGSNSSNSSFYSSTDALLRLLLPSSSTVVSYFLIYIPYSFFSLLFCQRYLWTWPTLTTRCAALCWVPLSEAK